MNRLWSRSGLRALSITMLLVGLVGGGYLSNDRHNQQTADAAHAQAQIDLTSQQQTQQQQAAAVAAAAPYQSQLASAEAVAQKNAAAAAAAAAKKAQTALDNARKEHAKAASRGTPRTTPTKTPSYGPIPKSCNSYTGNRAIGCSLLLSAGFGLDQMPCLDKMWTRESNWRTTAENPSSGSYGIPQALPANKMATYGSDYRSNPVPQIKWGLHYIEGRYKTPCGAWTFWQAHNWY